MLVNPDAMRKAQRELDTVLAGQLPTLNDVPALPYISNIFTLNPRTSSHLVSRYDPGSAQMEASDTTRYVV